MSAAYKVGFPSLSVQERFEKYLALLDEKTLRLVRSRLENLAILPRPPGKAFRVLRPPVSLFAHAAQYRLRVGDHRILYDIDDGARRVVLLAIKRRSERTYARR